MNTTPGAPTDDEIMEVGFRHFKPNPEVTPKTRGAFIAAVREILSLHPAPSAAEPGAKCPTCKAPCTTTVEPRGGDGQGWGTSDAERTRYQYAAPSTAQGLSDAEIERIYEEVRLRYAGRPPTSEFSHVVFARAILAAKETK